MERNALSARSPMRGRSSGKPGRPRSARSATAMLRSSGYPGAVTASNRILVGDEIVPQHLLRTLPRPFATRRSRPCCPGSASLVRGAPRVRSLPFGTRNCRHTNPPDIVKLGTLRSISALPAPETMLGLIFLPLERQQNEPLSGRQPSGASSNCAGGKATQSKHCRARFPATGP